MNSLKWAASLVAIAASLVVTTGTAHADPKAPAAAPAAGGMGIIAMPSIRQQIRQNAQAAGMWTKGTSLRLQYNATRTQVTAGLYNKSTFGGGPTPIKPTRLMNAQAQFHLVQVSEGKLAQPVKQEGRVWQPIYRMVLPPAGKPQ